MSLIVWLVASLRARAGFTPSNAAPDDSAERAAAARAMLVAASRTNVYVDH